jgi:hypothetical protein
MHVYMHVYHIHIYISTYASGCVARISPRFDPVHNALAAGDHQYNFILQG